jgi:hypothetical protein
MTKQALFVGAIVAALFIPNRLDASTFTFDTSDSQFDAGVDNQGWWRIGSSPVDPDTLNANYFVGVTTGILGRSETRDFFTFDLASLVLSGQTITSAVLQVDGSIHGTSPDPVTIGFFDVSTPAAALNNNSRINPTIFDDLGTGVSYGSFVVGVYADHELLSFQLNAAALADVASASGGFFSLGGALSNAANFDNAGIFGGSSNAGIQRLVITTEPTAVAPVPEPATVVLAGMGLALMIASRRVGSHVSGLRRQN